MKLVACTLAALGAAVVFVPPLARAAPSAGDICAARSTASLDALVSGNYANAVAHFSPTLGNKLDAAKMKQVWTQVQESAGAYRRHDITKEHSLQGQSVQVTPITFAKMPLDLLTACDTEGRISTYRLVPASMVKLLQSAEDTPPVKAHVLADGVRVQPMDVVSPPGPLHGVLTLPPGAGPFSAVVFVSGSGPGDMDETVGPNKPFRDLADGLARAGIASLRYDKRTHDYPRRWSENSGAVVDAEVTDDALRAAHALARLKAVDSRRVFVLGLSLGAMMAPRIGQRDPQLAGLIMMAAPARPLLAVLMQQTREQGKRQHLSAEGVKKEIAAIAAEQQLLDHAAPGKALDSQFMSGPQSYWMSLHDYHQVEAARSLNMPMLILQGGADFQVSPTLDYDRWKQVLAHDPHVAFHLYPGLSHLFMPAGNTGTVADYEAPAHVAPAVITDIAQWIKSRPARGKGAPL